MHRPWIYVGSAYGIVFLVLGLQALIAIWQHRRLLAELHQSGREDA